MKKLGLLVLTATISTLMSFSTMAGEWKQDDMGWWYDNGNTTYENNGWSWIDERWYYFTPEGYCVMNTTTPDGFQVNENGAWVIDDVVQTKGSDVAVISPILHFIKPEGFNLVSKSSNNSKTYSGFGLHINVADFDYEEDMKQRYPEGEHVVIDLDQESGDYTLKSSRQFNSGEWTLYVRDLNDYFSSGWPSVFTYLRIVDGHMHRIIFTGHTGKFDTDMIMNASVQ